MDPFRLHNIMKIGNIARLTAYIILSSFMLSDTPGRALAASIMGRCASDEVISKFWSLSTEVDGGRFGFTISQAIRPDEAQKRLFQDLGLLGRDNLRDMDTREARYRDILLEIVTLSSYDPIRRREFQRDWLNEAPQAIRESDVAVLIGKWLSSNASGASSLAEISASLSSSAIMDANKLVIYLGKLADLYIEGAPPQQLEIFANTPFAVYGDPSSWQAIRQWIGPIAEFANKLAKLQASLDLSSASTSAIASVFWTTIMSNQAAIQRLEMLREQLANEPIMSDPAFVRAAEACDAFLRSSLTGKVFDAALESLHAQMPKLLSGAATLLDKQFLTIVINATNASLVSRGLQGLSFHAASSFAGGFFVPMDMIVFALGQNLQWENLELSIASSTLANNLCWRSDDLCSIRFSAMYAYWVSMNYLIKAFSFEPLPLWNEVTGVNDLLLALKADQGTFGSLLEEEYFHGCPTPRSLTIIDVGIVSRPGSMTQAADGRITIVGGGYDIWGTSDSFHYAYHKITGDFDYVMKVESLVGNSGDGGWSKVELMARQEDPAQPGVGPQGGDPHISNMTTRKSSDTANSAVAGVNIRGPQWRAIREGNSSWTAPNPGYAPNMPDNWVRLERIGSVFYMYTSNDGTTWNSYNPYALQGWNTAGSWPPGTDNADVSVFSEAWPATVFLGIAVTAHNDGDVATAVVSNYGPYTPKPIVITKQPQATVLIAANSKLTLSVEATGDPIHYEWRKNGVAVPTNGLGSTYAIDLAKRSDSGSYTVRLFGGGTEVISSPSVVTVTTDTTAPRLADVSADFTFARVVVKFSEPVGATAEAKANYAIDKGVTVNSVSRVDEFTVRLTTTKLAENTEYTLTVNNVQDVPGSKIAADSKAAFKSWVFAQGAVLHKFWANNTANNIAALMADPRFPDSPTFYTMEPMWEYGPAGSNNSGDNYGNQLIGWFIPAKSGNYIFFTNSDEPSNLYLSTNEDPANKYLIAQETGWSNARNWVSIGSGNVWTKRSDYFADTEWPNGNTITLQAGKRYYMESLHTELFGGDSVAATFIMEGEDDPVNGDAPKLTGSLIGTYMDPTGISGTAGPDPARGAVAYWNFDGNLEDWIKDFDGTARGANPIPFVDSKAGFRKAIKLDGTDQFVEITGGNEDELEFPGGSMSIAGWFTVDTFDTSWQALIAKGELTSWRVARNAETDAIAYAGGVGEGPADVPAVNDGAWHHFVAVSDSTVKEFGTALYVDGTRYSVQPLAPVVTANSSKVMIGENPGARNREWAGSIDDIAIWNRVLLPEEIAQLYANGAGKPLGTFLPPPGGDEIAVTVSRSGGNLTIQWSPAGGTLETTSALGPTAAWSAVGAANPATVTIGIGNAYYRVRK